MNKKLFIRKTHRWLAVIIGIQLLFWTVSGAYFSLIHITTVRGEDRAVETASAILPKHLETVPPGRIVRTMETPIQRLELRMHSNGAPVYALYSKQTGNNRFPFTLIDAQTGQPLPPLDLEQATQRALADYEGNANIKSARLLTDNPPGEYKGPLPVWQVILDDARATHLYVSPVDGHILARRNTWWRTFDFLWMLHILDFDTRADFNNTLLRVVAPAAVLVVLSGYVLWWISRRRKIQSKSQP